ncbi:MAG: flippase-like domain-containing protein [Chitinophagaceae bacterium]|nr:flippase-like domain-containing protein [Chitinophagaceae bacterium]
MQKLKLKEIIQYVFFLGLGIGLIWYSGKDLTDEQLDQLKSSWKLARFEYIVPVVLALLASHYSRALRWMQLMKPLGYAPTRLNTYFAVLLGYFFNMLVPRLGEVMKCTVLAKYEKVAPDKLVGTILAERAVDMVSMTIVAILMVIIQFDRIGSYAIDTFAGLVKGKSGDFSYARLLLILLVIALLVAGVRWLFRRYHDRGLVVKIKKVGTGIWDGIKTLKQIDNLPLFIFHTIFIWSMYLVGIWIGFMAFPPVAHLGFQASVSVLIFGSLGMIATQGGIGAYQFAVEKTLLRFGIPNVMGLAFGWIIWASQTAITLLSGLFALVVMPIVNARKSNQA